MRHILAGIDIGSEWIKLVVGESVRGGVHILGVSCVPSGGVKRGFIIDPNAVLPKLQEAFQKCENMLGLKIQKVIATVPSDGIEFLMNEGMSTITNESHIIERIDIIRAMQASTYNKIEEDKEIVSITPVSYQVDEEKNVKKPLGMEANTIKVKTLVATIPRKNVFTIVKCLEKIGVEVIDYTLGSIGDYNEIESPMMKDVVGSIINIGYQTTTVSVFNKGLLTNTITLPVGSSSVEHDLAYMFHVNKKDAKNIKNDLASAHKRGVSSTHKIEYTTKEGESVTISEYEATEIASSRLEEILKNAKKEINLLTKKEIHYIMITGGVSEMSNFSILLEEVFGHHAKVANMKELGVRSNIYSSVVGLLKYYEEKMKDLDKEFSIFNEEETEELSSVSKKFPFEEHSILGKLFGYFFDN